MSLILKSPFIQVYESLILQLRHAVFYMDPPSCTGLHLKALSNFSLQKFLFVGTERGNSFVSYIL